MEQDSNSLQQPSAPQRRRAGLTGRILVTGAFILFLSLLLGAMGLVLVRREAGSFAGFGVNTVGRQAEVRAHPAPEFSLATLEGQPIRLTDLHGKTVIVNFWASWCPPCQDEARTVEAVWRSRVGQDVVFLGVNLWDAEPDARRFVDRFGVTYPTLLDANGRMAIEYGVTGIPETFGITADGVLLRHWVGPMTSNELQGLIDELRA